MKGIAAALLALLCALQLACLLRAPTLWFPSTITVTLAEGQTLALGRAELAAPQADTRHMIVRRALDGAWQLRNASAGKQVLAERADGEHRVGASTLQAGQQLRLGDAIFDVSAASPGAISLRGAGSRWDYDGAQLRRDGVLQARCPGTSWLSTFSAHALTFGGNLHCGDRIGVANLAPGAAAIRNEHGVLTMAGDAEEAMTDTSAITVGRTRLRVDAASTLKLQAMRHVALYPAPVVDLPPQVQWQWQQRVLWDLPARCGVGPRCC